MQIANGVDNDENKKKHRRACQAHTVARDGDVLLAEDSEYYFLHEAKHHVAECSDQARNLAMTCHTSFLILLHQRIISHLAR